MNDEQFENMLCVDGCAFCSLHPWRLKSIISYLCQKLCKHQIVIWFYWNKKIHCFGSTSLWLLYISSFLLFTFGAPIFYPFSRSHRLHFLYHIIQLNICMRLNRKIPSSKSMANAIKSNKFSREKKNGGSAMRTSKHWSISSCYLLFHHIWNANSFRIQIVFFFCHFEYPFSWK